MIQFAEWDTKHFGIKVGHLLWDKDGDLKSLMKDIELSKKERYDLLYLKGVELPKSVLNKNIILADQKVTYAITIKNDQKYISDTHVASVLHQEINEELLNLSFESGRYSRYNTDKRFPPNTFHTLYRIWMENSLNGKIATDVLAYMEREQPIGIITYRNYLDTVEIGLVAVNRQWANNGIGSRLMQSFFSKFNAGTNITVATQMCNSMACHYYEKNGFVLKSIENIYHIWNI